MMYLDREDDDEKMKPDFGIVRIHIADINHMRAHFEDMPRVAIMWWGMVHRHELVEVLQAIAGEEPARGIILIWEERITEDLSLGWLAEKIMKDTRQEIFLIQNTLESLWDIGLNLKNIPKPYTKQAQDYHKFYKPKTQKIKGNRKK